MMSRTEQIARRLDALWPISDHTWEADGPTILNEWGTPIALITDNDSADAIVDLVTHSVGDLRWALGEIARLEAVARELSHHVTRDGLPDFTLAQLHHIEQSITQRFEVCPLCHALDATSVIEESRHDR